ncbi:alpha/beta fold hydrolase [Microbispora sp. NPDC049125]|uniref:alpha/beta fold hydrolase n=1 Tax=Microbispora sp. NPDC049125 TaxID=3154929 RepID=UPI00346753B8
MPEGTTCGFLLVPERRDVPNSRTIKVAYAVHRSTAHDRRPDPVVYSSGGPGSRSLQLTGMLSAMFPERDVVVIDQRGGRDSEPRLECPEVVQGIVATLQTPGPSDRETAPVIRGALECQARLEREHVDLRGYRTAEIAADVVDLRKALGYASWDLFGVSYSTRSMLQAAARDPQGSRTVVLDSFLPAGRKWYDEAVPSLASSVAKLGITKRFGEMVARLDAHPATFVTRDPLTRKRITLQLNGGDVATILEEALHETDVIPLVPALVDALADGNTALLQPFVDEAGGGLTSHDWGLYYAVQCQDEAPFNSFPGGKGLRLFTGVADEAVCGAWKLPAARGGESDSFPPGATTPASAAFSSASGSGRTAAGALPVLVMGGQYDPTTPPEAARDAARSLPDARFTEFAGIGHAVFLSSECGRRTIAVWLDDPTSAAPPCDPAKPPYPIVRPGDRILTSSVYKVLSSPVLGAPGAAFVVVSLVQLLGGLIALLRRRRGLLTAAAGLAGLLLAGLTALTLSGVSNQTELAIGLPRPLAWYGLLALVSTALSTTEAFRLRSRAVHIIPAIAGLAFIAWLYGWLLA